MTRMPQGHLKLVDVGSAFAANRLSGYPRLSLEDHSVVSRKLRTGIVTVRHPHRESRTWPSPGAVLENMG